MERNYWREIQRPQIVISSPVTLTGSKKGGRLSIYNHILTPVMDFGWNWLGQEKNKEENSSEEDKNPKHRRRS